MKNSINFLVGKIIHIGKLFESYDGYILENRYLTIIGIEDENILLVPMSTFHNQAAKIKKLSYKENYPYLKNDGSKKDCYLKCDQIYVLTYEDFNKIKEIKLVSKMNDKYFKKLRKHIEELFKEKQNELVRKDIIFKEKEPEFELE